ncbi:MAG: ubiquitin-like protein Pup [Candidatus Rokubacteria bacterium]|nr:ubiquitin-like protein Pup [Candidatus Rokubacteria bacterium]
MSPKTRVSRPSDTCEKSDTSPSPSLAGKGEKIKQELDELLDEIDGVLESNAEEFVSSYVQRGGQ